MFGSIALSALAALTLASAPAPSMAQTGVPGASPAQLENCTKGDRCRELRRNDPGSVAQNPRQNVPPGYYRDDRPNRPDRPDRPRPPRYEDPGYYRPDPRPRPPHYPRPPIYGDPGYYRPPVYESRYRVSCREARQIVRSEGFRDVRAVDCEGRSYQFEARRKGRAFLVVVSSRSGDIIDVSRL